MERILVPTDFSKEAENALRVAAQLAKKFDAKIYALNMLELPADVSSSDATTGMAGEQGPPESLLFLKLARQRFQKLLDQDFLKGVDVTDTVEFRNTFAGIIDSVQKYDVDLIVMGSAGASGMQEIFVGSNTEKVVRNSEIPVLAVKGEVANFEVKDFVFATDLNEKGRVAFGRALRFAKLLNAKTHLVYINTPNRFKTTQEAQSLMKEFTEDARSNNYETYIYNDESVEKGILHFTDDVNAQLTGVATNGRRGIAHLLNGSISEDLVNHANFPVITFRV